MKALLRIVSFSDPLQSSLNKYLKGLGLISERSQRSNAVDTEMESDPQKKPSAFNILARDIRKMIPKICGFLFIVTKKLSNQAALNCWLKLPSQTVKEDPLLENFSFLTFLLRNISQSIRNLGESASLFQL